MASKKMRRIEHRRTWVWLVALHVLFGTGHVIGTGLSTAGAQTTIVGRATIDRNVDLWDALIRNSKLDEATQLCELILARSAPGSVPQILWTAKHCRTRAAQQLARGVLSDEALTETLRPLDELEPADTDATHALWLRYHRLEILRDACFQDCIAASIQAPTSDDAQRAMNRAAKVVSESDELLEEVHATRLRIDASTSDRNTADRVGDLDELSQRLRTGAIRTLLLVTNIFPDESVDQHDAASKAERFATTSIDAVEIGSPAWLELKQLQVEAILRGGDVARAATEFDSLGLTTQSPQSTRSLALRLRLGLAKEQWASVMRELDSYYGTDPSTVTSPFEIDLVRLEWLLAIATLDPETLTSLRKDASSLTKEVDTWIDAIERRHGLYERRYAESLVLRQMRRTTETKPTLDRLASPAMVAAQGEDWLRRGDPIRAGEMLAAAALAETNPDSARKHAAKAAAVFVSQKDSHKAASILYRVALRHPADAALAELPLQAAMLLYQAGREADVAEIDSMLRATLEHWPNTTPGVNARSWLIERCLAQERYVDAAEVATFVPEGGFSATQAAAIAARWHEASLYIPPSDLESLSQRFLTAFAPILEDETTRSQTRGLYVSAAAVALTRNDLERLTPASWSGFEEDIWGRTIQFRRDMKSSEGLKAVPDSARRVIENRLMNDGRLDPTVRVAVASLLETWPSQDQATLDRVVRLCWLDRSDDANREARRLVVESPSPGSVIESIATALAESGQHTCQRLAVEWWEELASGLPKGKPTWYSAKLRAAQLLAQLGQTEEASKRAKYVLITKPPSDPSVLDSFQRLSESR